MEDSFKLEYEDIFDSPQDLLKILRREPQIPYPLHTHEFSELVIITRGQGYHYFEGGEEYPVMTGDVFTLQGNRAHGYHRLTGLCLINIMYNPLLLKEKLQDLNNLSGYHALFHLEPAYRKQHNFSSRLHLKPIYLSQIISLAEKMEREQQEKNGAYRFITAAYFMELTGYLCRAYSNNINGDTRELMAIGRALAYLEERENQSVRLDELSSVSGMTVSTLTRHFNRALGMPPIEYHLRLRIKSACNLLRNTDYPVTEVAFRAGFEDSNYFTRQFKKIMNCTPRSYRQN
jgi:AraC-like DNA-binding protein